MKKWAGVGAVGAALGAALTTICCLPVAAALGAGVLAVGSALTPFQLPLAFVSLVLLLVAFVQTLRAPECDEEGACARPRSRFRWVFFGVMAVVTLALITLPYWSASLLYWSL